MKKILGILLASIACIQSGEAKKQKIIPCPSGAAWCIAETLQEPEGSTLDTQINAADEHLKQVKNILDNIKTKMKQ